MERSNASRSNVDPNYIGRSIETICDDQNVRRVDAKGHLFVEGDPKSHVYKIASRAICLYRIQLDGRRQIIEFAFEGDLIGIGSAAVQSCNAQALVSTRLKYLSLYRHIANAARRDVKIALGLYEALSCEQIRSREHLSYLGRRGATERLAAFLVGLSRRNHETGRNPRILWLPMTRVDIADYLLRSRP